MSVQEAVIARGLGFGAEVVAVPQRVEEPSRVRTQVRPHVRGKSFFVGEEKYYVRGVTYGPFEPDERWGEYGTPEQVEADFSMMASMGLNTVRVYTVPPL